MEVYSMPGTLFHRYKFNLFLKPLNPVFGISVPPENRYAPHISNYQTLCFKIGNAIFPTLMSPTKPQTPESKVAAIAFYL